MIVRLPVLALWYTVAHLSPFDSCDSLWSPSDPELDKQLRMDGLHSTNYPQQSFQGRIHRKLNTLQKYDNEEEENLSRI